VLGVASVLASGVACGSVAAATKHVEARKAERAEEIVSVPIVWHPPLAFTDAEAMSPRKVEARRLTEIEAARVAELGVPVGPKPVGRKAARRTKNEEVAAAAAVLAKAKGVRTLE